MLLPPDPKVLLARQSISLVRGGGNINTTLNERFGAVLNGDNPDGHLHWVTQHFKVSASYRLNAIVNVQNLGAAAVTNLISDRYTHGPRLAVTAQF